jgi:hypothetical protein
MKGEQPSGLQSSASGLQPPASSLLVRTIGKIRGICGSTRAGQVLNLL